MIFSRKILNKSYLFYIDDNPYCSKSLDISETVNWLNSGTELVTFHDMTKCQ